MAKDFVGLNICVRDIFQGNGECGHPYETNGHSELNVLGFKAPAGNGNKSFKLTFNWDYSFEDGNWFEIPLSKVSTDPDALDLLTRFEFDDDGAPQTNVPLTDGTPIDLIETTGLALVSPAAGFLAARNTVADRIIQTLESRYNFWLIKKVVRPDGMVEIDFELLADIPTAYADDGIFTDRVARWNGSAYAFDKGSFKTINPTSPYYDPWYNDGAYILRSHQVLHAINVHRNGPYGWPSWKQIRTGENRLFRYHKQNNKITVVKPSEEISIPIDINRSAQVVIRRNHGVECFDEPAVTSKHHPLETGLGQLQRGGRSAPYPRSMTIRSSYNNKITFFSNSRLNNILDTPDEAEENFKTLKDLYLNGALDDDRSPFNSFHFLKFKQTVFPREAYTYKGRTRTRVNYSSGFWRTHRAKRVLSSSIASYDNGFGTNLWQTSIWPLDTTSDQLAVFLSGGLDYNFSSSFLVDDQTIPLSGFPRGSASYNQDQGILQNNYCQFATDLVGQSIDVINMKLAPAPVYARKQTHIPGGSLAGYPLTDYNNLNTFPHVNPSGLLAMSGSQSSIINYGLSKHHRFKGDANWDVPLQTGRQPFYDSAEQFYDKVRNKYKDYSILPEFRMSDNVEFFLENGIMAERSNLFTLDGAATNLSSSANEDFYKVYSTTDFLKNFEIIEKEHRDFVESSIVSLKCKAVKKLIPYDGFYPVQRTVDLAKQFYNSYKDQIKITKRNGINASLTASEQNLNYGFQNLMQPLFAPGILFNTIKSGVACDWPLVLKQDSYYEHTDHYEKGLWFEDEEGGEAVPGAFHLRIPFEALVEPEKYLSNFELINFERHGATGSEVYKSFISCSVLWNGRGNNLYKKMANNFCAEVPHFFLEKQNFTTITSLPQRNPNFGNAKAGETYGMRLKMYRTMEGANGLVALQTGDLPPWTPPQDLCSGSYAETLTMYSRPSAFGPPCQGYTYGRDSWAGIESHTLVERTNHLWTDTEVKIPATRLTKSGGGNTLIYKGFQQGYNFPFTPPYYHGEAWAEFTFTAAETKKYTLAEIMNSCSVDQWRFDTTFYSSSMGGFTDGRGPQTMYKNLINKNALQLTSSVNLFGKGQIERIDLEDDGTQGSIKVVVDSIEEDRACWVIQTKFETPILNFNKYAHLTDGDGEGFPTVPYDSTSIEPPIHFLQHQAAMVDRGMWHQFGEIPNENVGVYMEVGNIPIPWAMTAKPMRDGGPINEDTVNALRMKSLADLCGFKTTPVKLGKIAPAKKIREAVVAVPFFEEDGMKKFFSLPRGDITNAQIGIAERLVGESIIDMVQKMSRYNFPPSMDFLNYETVDPFAMYIFEFEHVLTQQDLSYIWQGVLPDIGLVHEESEATITHELLAHELLGGGAKIITSEEGKLLDESAKGNDLPVDIRWMVFKVKQKAQTSYYDKIIGKKERPVIRRAGEQMLDVPLPRDKITYNWPYDFFSLVELVKIDAEIEFSKVERDTTTRARRIVPIRGSPESDIVLVDPADGLRRRGGGGE